MAEITKRIVLFLISLVLIILYLVSATTSYAKDEFETDTTEQNFRFYTMEWVDAEDENQRKFVCGTKVSTFDYTGQKLVFEYYYLIREDNKIVTRFDVSAVQMTVLNVEPVETEELKLNLHGVIINKDGDDILAGVKSTDTDFRGVATEYNELDIIGNTEIFKALYYGGYDVLVYFFPGASTAIPIIKNENANTENDKKLVKCIIDLLDNQKERDEATISVDEDIVHRIG